VTRNDFSVSCFHYRPVAWPLPKDANNFLVPIIKQVSEPEEVMTMHRVERNEDLMISLLSTPIRKYTHGTPVHPREGGVSGGRPLKV